MQELGIPGHGPGFDTDWGIWELESQGLGSMLWWQTYILPVIGVGGWRMWWRAWTIGYSNRLRRAAQLIG